MKINNTINTLQSFTKPKIDIPQNDNEGFSKALSGYINSVNHSKNVAEEGISALATGKTENISKTVLDIQKADVEMQLTLAIRNKLVEAYKEIMRMQV